MQLYLYILIFVSASLVILLIRFLLLRRTNIPVELFFHALRNENNGQYEAALIDYESALNEVKKIRYHKKLKTKIIEKLKLLRTVIEYEKSCLHLTPLKLV